MTGTGGCENTHGATEAQYKLQYLQTRERIMMNEARGEMRRDCKTVDQVIFYIQEPFMALPMLSSPSTAGLTC
jgi:hypothetical protein